VVAFPSEGVPTLITITRKQARQIRMVFRRGLNVTGRSPEQPVLMHAGAEGLVIRAHRDDVSVEYREFGDRTPCRLAVPLDLLAECEGSRNEPVELAAKGDREVTVRWRNDGIPVVRQYRQPGVDGLTDGFPQPTTDVVENAPRLLQALQDAMETTSVESHRYALQCVQLRGQQGTLAATDGRQLLLQSGFSFPWDDDVLIRRTSVFGAKTLPQDQPVRVGRSEKFVSIGVGRWTFSFAICADGRFPVVEDHIAEPEMAVTQVNLSEADAHFLAKALRSLPNGDDPNVPVTVDVNGHVAIRARSESSSQTTDLTLTGSTSHGDSLRLNTSRRYLERAVRLGFRHVHLFDDSKPVLCQDQHRSFVWALLEPDSAIKPSDDALRIESPRDEGTDEVATPKPKRQPTMKNTNGSQNRHAQRAETEQSPGESIDGLIDQTETLKTTLRETLSQTTALVASLKQHRKKTKRMRSTLLSLKQLQAMDA